MQNRLNILSESLDQKLNILGEIQKFNELQADAFSKETADLEEFDRGFEEKDKLIDELDRLDDGFEALYENLAQELQNNKVQYASQIRELQEKIAKVTELSVSIQAQEMRNKKLVEDYFAKTRNDLKQNRQTSKAAYDYYKSMSGIAYSTSRIMDNKQ
ncbi:MAG: hypothetical protein IJ716_09740 [Lachnospiraceae bacterium]|nr:hypothetical protein [Lachnospiraceae bacterium]